MGGDWERAPIGTVAEIFDGPHATPKTVNDGPIFLGIDTLDNGRLNLGETRHVTEEDYATWTRRVEPREGDVVFSYETRIGEAAIIPKGLRCCLGRRLALIRTNPSRLNSRFLLYQYLGPKFQDHLKAHTKPGSTVDRLHLTDFPGFPIVLPPLRTQEAIANLLGALDDKIELNQRMAETLEAMARALFKGWFVDFDPVRAKAEGRPTGLPDDLAALFPDAFGADKLPSGWMRRKISDVFNVRIGRTPPRKEPQWFSTNGDDVPWMSIRDLGRSGTFVDETKEYLTREAVSRFNVPTIAEGSVVLSFKLTVGRVAIAGRDMLSNEAIAHFIPRDTDSPDAEFFYCSLKAFNWNSVGSTSSIATAFNSDSVRDVVLTVPPAAVVARFVSVVRPLFQRIKSLQAETAGLAHLRDTLLPRLISGELRIRDVESEIEAA